MIFNMAKESFQILSNFAQNTSSLFRINIFT